MKKLCSIVLVICMLCLAACSNNNTPTSSPSSSVAPNKLEATSTPQSSAAPGTEATKAPETVDLKSLPSLREIYKDDFLIGTIYAEPSLGEKDIELMDTQFNVITPENIMKPEAMQAEEGTFTYDSADKMVDFAKEHNLQVVAHNLVWHQQIPGWMQEVTDRETAIKQLKEHITNVAGHYKGKVISWDVVNEAIEDNYALPQDGDWTKCLRYSKWVQSIGPDYLALAFKFAKEAAPDCKLYYNDYNLSVPQKADVAYAMIKSMIDDGVPIDGIGMQGHYQTGVSAGGLEYALEKFSTLGIEISMTELDVTCSKVVNGELTEEGEIQQALTYAQIFQKLKQYSDKIVRVTFWGNTDTQSWRSEQFPCLFDGNYVPKEAFYAVADPEGYLKKHAGEIKIGDAQEGTATYGTPTIDGEEEALWDQTEAMKVNKQVLAWEGATGTVKALWDEKHLYILFHVKDDVLDTSGTEVHTKDSIEIFLDQKNDKKGSYGDDDGQYRVNCKGKLTFGTVPTEDGVEAVVKEEAGGYMVEMVIPFNQEMKADTVVGFDAQINDCKLGNRQSIAKFSDTTDNSYLSTEYYGNLTLKK